MEPLYRKNSKLVMGWKVGVLQQYVALCWNQVVLRGLEE